MRSSRKGTGNSPDFRTGQPPDHRHEVLVRRLNASADVEDLAVECQRTARGQQDRLHDIADVNEVVREARLCQWQLGAFESSAYRRRHEAHLVVPRAVDRERPKHDRRNPDGARRAETRDRLSCFRNSARHDGREGVVLAMRPWSWPVLERAAEVDEPGATSSSKHFDESGRTENRDLELPQTLDRSRRVRTFDNEIDGEIGSCALDGVLDGTRLEDIDLQ